MPSGFNGPVEFLHHLPGGNFRLTLWPQLLAPVGDVLADEIAHHEFQRQRFLDVIPRHVLADSGDQRVPAVADEDDLGFFDLVEPAVGVANDFVAGEHLAEPVLVKTGDFNGADKVFHLAARITGKNVIAIAGLLA